MKRAKRNFTLLELIIAMAVFGLFAVGMMQFFNTTQNVMITSSGSTEMMDRARTALDMMAGDLSCAWLPAEADGAAATQTVWKDISSDSESFAVVTKRQGKVQDDSGSYSSTKIVSVIYEFNNNKLMYGQKTDTISVSGVNADTDIVDGVAGFRVNAKKSSDAKLPFMVTLELDLYPWDDWVKSDYGNDTGALNKDHIWTFTRIVTIDRGQKTSN